MEQQKKPREDEAEATERKAASGQERAAGAEEQGESQSAEQDEEAGKANEAAGLGQFVQLYSTMTEILEAGSLEIPHNLAPAQQHALELLFQAKAGEHENNVYAAGIQCMRFLNKSLATLHPTLSAAMQSSDPAMQQMYKDLQARVGGLRLELRQRIMKEAHRGGRRRKPINKPAGDDKEQRAVERSQLGSLAWELAQLVAKRKRKRFSHDKGEHTVGLALEAMAGTARALGKHAADLARLDAKLAATQDTELRAGLQEQLDAAGKALLALLTNALELAQASEDANEPGAHASLRDRLAPVTKKARLDSIEGALAAARHYVEISHGAMDDQDAIVRAEQAGGEKRGILGSLFGRRKKS